MDDAHPFPPRHLAWQRRAVPACEDVHLMAAYSQLPRDLANVNVLSTAIDAARRRNGRSMFADNGDSPHVFLLAFR